VVAVDLLKQCGATGAVVLLAVDGTLNGRRQRARFFARNANVPLMLVAVGPAASLTDALPRLRELSTAAVVTIERVQALRTRGRSVADPIRVAERDASGLPLRQKIMVYVEEPATVDGHALYLQLIRRLHAAGAAGVTVLRAVRGFYDDHGPFADSLLSLRRRVPMIVTAIDTPANVRRWWPVIEELTSRAGLVTSELVPAVHAAAGGGAPQLDLAATPTAPGQSPPA
jgi:PII-like signaling protein